MTGTTLEILAPYLPYGVEVAYTDGKSTNRWPFIRQVDVEHQKLKRDSLFHWEPINRFLPVLYSFEDLASAEGLQCLKDAGYPKAASIKRTGALMSVYDESDWLLTVVYPDWGIGIGGLVLSWAQACYKNHFAVGLGQDQYIRKTR